MTAQIIATAGLKGRGARGNVYWRAPCDLFHDVIICKNYVFADSLRSRLLFPVVENVLTQLHMQLAARNRVFDINFRVYSYYEKIFHRLESHAARNNIHPNNKQKSEIQTKNPEK